MTMLKCILKVFLPYISQFRQCFILFFIILSLPTKGQNLIVTGISYNGGDANGVYSENGTNIWTMTSSPQNITYTILLDDNNFWELKSNGTFSDLFFQNEMAPVAIDQVVFWESANTSITGNPIVTLDDGTNPEMVVTGKGIQILDGDESPSFYDNTRFPAVDKLTNLDSERTFTIYNGVNSSSVLSSIAVTSDNSNEFSIKTSPSSSINGGESTTFTITFNPSDIGVREATISITNNDSDENPYTFKISGRGIAPVKLLVSDADNSPWNGTYEYRGILGNFEYWSTQNMDYFIYGFDSKSTINIYPVTPVINWVIDNDTNFDNDNDISYTETTAASPIALSSEDYVFIANFWFLNSITPTIVSEAECIIIRGNDYCISNGLNAPNSLDGTDFGMLVPGESKTVEFSIENPGTEQFEISSINFDLNADLFSSNTTFPLTIAGNSSQTVIITFTVPADFSNIGEKVAQISLPCSALENGESYTFGIKGEVAAKKYTFITSGDWGIAGNWDLNDGTVPNENSMVVIQAACTVAQADAKALSVEVEAGGTLTIESTGGLTVTQNTTVTSNAQTSGSLIVTSGGTFNSALIYERYLTNSNQWHLISSPVSDQGVWNFVTEASNEIAFNTDEMKYALPRYNVANDEFDNYPTTSSSDIMQAGIGFSTLRDNAETVSFVGTINTGEITQEITSGGNNIYKWNLLGNPYSSAVRGNGGAAESNLLTTNSGILDPNYAALYLWDPSINQYITINNTSTDGNLQACQGFFVKSSDMGGTFTFEPAMQLHDTNQAFKSVTTTEAEWSFLSFTATCDKGTSSTSLAFHPDMTRGLDVTYDAGKFKSEGLNLYTKLLEGSDVDFDIQCLPNEHVESYSIPLGIDLSESSEVLISMTRNNFPLEKSIYLYDTLNDSYFDLTFSSFKTVINPEDKDRFFIRFQEGVVNGIAKQEDNLRVITIRNTIRILNPKQHLGTCTVYDITGGIVTNCRLSGQPIQDLYLPEFTGVCIVRLNAGSKLVSHKCVIP